jgi:hypothetical protein
MTALDLPLCSWLHIVSPEHVSRLFTWNIYAMNVTPYSELFMRSWYVFMCMCGYIETIDTYLSTSVSVSPRNSQIIIPSLDLLVKFLVQRDQQYNKRQSTVSSVLTLVCLMFNARTCFLRACLCSCVYGGNLWFESILFSFFLLDILNFNDDHSQHHFPDTP